MNRKLHRALLPVWMLIARVATKADVYSMFYNPAKVVFNDEESGAGLTYTPWLSELNIKSIYLLSGSGFYKLNEHEAISVGIRYFSMGNLVFTDNVGQEIKNFKPNDLSVEAGYSRKLTEKTSVGLNLRYIHSSLADNTNDADYKSGSSVAADLGFYTSLKKGWTFGAALTNLGAKINYGGTTKSFIPANLSIGTAYDAVINEGNNIVFGLELNKLLVPTPPDPSDVDAVNSYNNKSVIGSWFSSYGDAPDGFKEELREFQVGVGAEYCYQNDILPNDQFFLRVGYFSENKTKGERNYVTTGVGLKYKTAAINLSYLIPTGTNSYQNALRNTLRFSVAFGFNNK